MAKKKTSGDAYSRQDTWQNGKTGLGIVGTDQRQSTSMVSDDPQTVDELDALYQDDLIGLIVDLPPREMVRKWIKFSVDGDTDRAAKVMQRLEEIGARGKCRDALTWGRLYGGGILVLGVNDGNVDMSKPLDENRIKAIRWLDVLDRHDVSIGRRYADQSNQKFGKPETYRVTSGANESLSGREIHETRVIIFDGLTTTRRDRARREGWGMPVVERLTHVIRDFQASYSGVFAALTHLGETALRVEGLASKLAQDPEGAIMSRIRNLHLFRSIFRILPLDARESVDQIGAVMTGVDAILDRVWMRVSSASRIPVTLLAGRSPAGMQATGESDMIQFYDYISSEQEDRLRPPLERLCRIILLEDGKPEPESWKFEFVPLKQMTEKETADLRKTVAETDEINILNGLVSAQEVRESRWTADGYSADTVLLEPGARGELPFEKGEDGETEKEEPAGVEE